jgi:hypothetical protein
MAADAHPHPASASASASSSASPPDERALTDAVILAWESFFQRFREDEQEFERLDYQTEAPAMLDELKAATTPEAQRAHAVEALRLLDDFAGRRFAEQNRRIDEMVDLCEQMRQRLESSELNRTHLQDECSHTLAIITAAMARHRLGPPKGLDHPPRMHNLLNHLLGHFEPQSPSLDTGRYLKSPEAAKREASKSDEPVFDYERLRRLFRKD